MNLIFGIYPGGPVSKDFEAIPDDPEQIKEALDRLQENTRLFLVRGYLLYIGMQTIESEVPKNMLQYVADGRKLDLTLCYRSITGDLEDWKSFIIKTIQLYGENLSKIQITEEPNNPNPATGGDGGSPNIIQAIIEGVCSAKEEINRLGYNILVGFNAVVSFSPHDTLWTSLAQQGHQKFIDCLDYVGLDFFPDVFHPLPHKPNGSPISMEEAVSGVLSHFRNNNLKQANIPFAKAIHITENCWATNPDRTEERQAEILITTLYSIEKMRHELNITHYEYFDLRDADSSSGDLQFGLLRDDYSPKPAFEAFCSFIDNHG